MAHFIVIPIKDNTLRQAIPAHFGNASYRLPSGAWLVSYTGTSKQLSDELGISDGQKGTAVVFSVSGYWGFAGRDLWEWLEKSAG